MNHPSEYNSTLARMWAELPLDDQIRLGLRERELKLDYFLTLAPHQLEPAAEALSEHLDKQGQTTNGVKHRKRSAHHQAMHVRRLGMVLANALRAKGAGRACFYSRSKKDFRLSYAVPDYAGVKPLAEMIDTLTGAGYLTDGKVKGSTRNVVSSTFRATEKLEGLVNSCAGVPRFDLMVATRPALILKDDKKRIIDFQWTPELREWETTVRAHNAFMVDHRVELPSEAGEAPENVFRPLCRIFNNGSFEEGGRFYYAPYQLLQVRNKQERQRVLINGNRTIEVDYGGFQPRLCYHELGIECPGDPYDIPALKTLLGNSLCPADIRLVAKDAMVILLNSGPKAKLGAHKHRFEDKFNQGDQTKVIFDICRMHHTDIESLMLCKHGMTLMNIESDIANHIINDSLNDRIPLCIIHDSFIVEECNESWLREHMINRYYEKVGLYPVIK